MARGRGRRTAGRSGSSGDAPGTARRLHHDASGAALRSAQHCARPTGQVDPRHRTRLFHVNPRTARTTARALADAFLGAREWQVPDLVARGRLVLDAEPDWLTDLARAAVTAWRVTPHDAPAELARVLLAVPGVFEPPVSEMVTSGEDGEDDDEDGFLVWAADEEPEGWQGARAAAPGSPRVVRWLPAHTRMGRTPWRVAPLDDLADVAELLATDLDHLAWYADRQGRQRAEPSGRLQLYRRHWRVRPGRVPRLLETPRPRLRTAQRVLLDRVLAPVPPHPAAHGFVTGRSAVTGAQQHVGADVVLTMDLAAFFATVTSGRVYATLRTAGYPEPVADLLTGLLTTRATRDDLATMPPGGSDAARAHVRSALAAPHLPQGAPSSPQLANLCAQRLDRRLAGYAAAAGAVYTRYADDLTFSGGPDVARRVGALRHGVARIVAAEGFALQPAKTRVRGRGARQTVTGIVVNDRTSLPRRELDALRARLTNAVRLGPSVQDLAAFDGDRGALRAHLAGRVAWVAQVHPVRGERLAALLAAVDWDPVDTHL